MLTRFEDALARHRMVCIVGPGGVGKTRLAVELTARRSDVVWVDLLPAVDVASMVHCVARALGSTGVGGAPVDANALGAIFRGPPTLLVLDNLEQLLPQARGVIEAWLKTAPELRVLSTSRIATAVEGELILRLGPLELPSGAQMSGPAFDLFVDRVRLRSPSFTVLPEEAPSVRALLERLEGMPLAIELAASRVPLLGIASLVLDEGGIELLRDATEASLEASLLRSWDLLDEAERSALGELSVFRSDFTLEAAEAVIDPAHRPVDQITSLFDQSLLRSTSERRLGLYRAIADVAAPRTPAAKKAAAKARHRAYYRRRAEENALTLLDASEIEGLIVEAESDADACFWFAALHRLARQRPLSSHLRLRLDEVLERCTDAPEVIAARVYLLRARTSWLAGALTEAIDDTTQARTMLRTKGGRDANNASAEALGLAARCALYLGDLDGTLRGLSGIDALAGDVDDFYLAERAGLTARVHMSRGEIDAARRAGRQLRDLALRIGSAALELDASVVLGVTSLFAGREDEALEFLEPALTRARSERLPRMEALLLVYAGVVHFVKRDLSRARTRLDEAVALERTLENRLHEGFARALRSAVHARADRIDEALEDLRLAQVAVGIDPLSLIIVAMQAGHVSLARARLARKEGDREAVARHLERAASILTAPIELDDGTRHDAVHVAETNDDVRLVKEILERALRESGSVEPSERTLVLEGDAAWVIIDGGKPVPLRRRGLLRRLLLRLVEAHARGESCTRQALIEVGWPRERAQREVLRNRLNVAMSELRQLGLADLLEHTEEGHRILPSVRVTATRTANAAT